MMKFVDVISKAFEEALLEDAKIITQFQSISLTSSSNSSSSSSNNNINIHHGGPNKTKPTVHLLSSEWMNQFQTFKESKLEADRPEIIVNAPLLQSYNPNSKIVITALSSTSSLEDAVTVSDANVDAVTDADADADIDTNSTTVVGDTARSESTSSESEKSNTSNGVMIGTSTCCSPSSTTTNNSFVLVDSDAQSFVKDETATVTATSTTTAITTKEEEEEEVEKDEETKNAMDERTKRRLKWATKKEESEQKQSETNTTTSSTSNNNNNNNDQNHTTITTPNKLKKNLQHKIDYYIIGDNQWLLLSGKFGFDIDIQLPLLINDTIPNSLSGGWGRVCVIGLKEEGTDLILPENGLFDYQFDIATTAATTYNTATTTTTTDSYANHDSDNDSCNGNNGNNSETDNWIDEKLFHDESSDTNNDNNETSASAIILLPPPSYVDTSASTISSSTYHNNNNSNSNSNSVSNSNSNDNDNNNSTVISTNPRKRKRYGMGLENLGNTCFMNSTLQCLAHTGPLRSYFLSGEFANDLNRDNPLGTGGELAVEFAKLLAEIWGTKSDNDDDDGNNTYSSTSRHGGYRRTWSTSSGSYNAVYPRDFKKTLGYHAEQFMGYNQHDSQELATYLLDALHEDTNRISKKPYIEKPEQGEDELDYDAAKRAWELHLKREDSKVMENFMGQVKSRVECPMDGCGRVSTTFDPFMYLSVPLPGASERTIEVEYHSMDPEVRAKELKITLSKNSNCSELKKRIAEMVNEFVLSPSAEDIKVENIVLAENFQKEIYTFYKLNDDISKIRGSDNIVAFEVASVSSIHEETKIYEENKRISSANDNANICEQLDVRPNGRLPLDLSIRAKLNRSLEWETTLSDYIAQPTFFPTLMNTKRRSTEERSNFHTNLCKFLNRCYASPECTSLLQGRSSPSSDLELLSCDGEDSEDGKMSPTSTVEALLGATVVNDETSPSLEELCAASAIFQNVKTPRDVAILEFCSKKFRRHLKNEKDKKLDYTDGAEIQLVFRKNARLGNQSQTYSSPFVLRISPTLTVFGLREMIANRLSRVLQTTGGSTSDSDNIKEEKIEHETSDVIDCASDQDEEYQHSYSSDALNIMRQIPLTYQAGGTSFTPYKYGSKGSIYRKLGSIVAPNESSSSSQRSLFAKPDDEDEQEHVLDHVQNHGKVNICLVTSAFEKMFNDEEWTTTETASDPNQEDEESKVTSVIDCVSKYCQIEQLEETEMWYCSRCKEHVRAWKQFHLYRTPPILIIHLKRFHYSALTHRRDKIDTLIDFPLEGMDLRDEVMFSETDQEPIYDCYAVSNHFGGLNGGHYTAYALNDDGEWSNFDDSRVTKNVDKSEVVSKSAYVLYYKRRDVKIDEDSWTTRALPALCSRQPSSPSATDMDIEGGDTDNENFSIDNNDDDDYGIKTYQSLFGDSQ